MLGYIRIDGKNLTWQDYGVYESRYCLICRQIAREYGNLYRPILSYDVVFLCLLLENTVFFDRYQNFRCLYGINPRIWAWSNQKVIEFCAFLSVYLLLVKLQDDVMDEGSYIKQRLRDKILENPGFSKKLQDYGDSLDVLEEKMKEIHRKENEQADPELLLHLFGEYLTQILLVYYDVYPVKRKNPKILDLAYQMGKWIYLIDAYDDLETDKKKGNFNLLLKEPDPDLTMGKYHAVLREKMKDCLSELGYRSILENIVGDGCEKIYQKIRAKRSQL